MPSVNAASQHAEPYVPPEAPIFRPNPEEFEHPLRYIASIRPTAEAYGICKVVPPAGWKPPYVVDRETFRFKTRIQSVHELQDRPNAQEAANQFQEDFEAFLQSTGRPIKKAPVFAGAPIDLSKLYQNVVKRGGYDLVTRDKGWRDVGRNLQLDDKSSNAAYTLRQVYQKHLLPFEEYDRARENSPDSSQCIAAQAGLKPSSRSSEPRDDAEEAADILNAIMGLSSLAKEPAPPAKRARSMAADSKTAPNPSSDGIRVPDNIFTLNCELCKGGHHEEKIILCDRCDRGCHLFCLSPPLEQVPEGEWLCPMCKAEEAHGFVEGQQYSLVEFEKTATSFKKSFFGGQAAAKKATLEMIETEFWKVVEAAEDPVEVLYGADIDTTITGSGFPQKGSSDSPYAEHGWNLNNLPKLGGTYGSMLRTIEENIPGVVVPWMYIGMMFSSFCWHIEDHMFYSINYHHWGDAKKWYGVPGSAGHFFEEAFRKALPGHFDRQPDLLFHLTTLLSPRVLHQYNVPVYSATQHEGEFVITFPNAYHGGFNMGFNCAEAVNFAPADWFRFGGASTERFRTFRKPSVVSHEGLLLKVAETDSSPETCYWAKQDLQRVLNEEQQWRCKLWSTGVKRSRRTDLPRGFHKDDKDEAECAICHLFLHCSGLECDCSPGRRVCLQHADNLCECDPSRWRLVYRYSLQDLHRILQQVCTHIPGEGSDIQRTDSYLGVTPVALTNTDATKAEATEGAPVTGPGLTDSSPHVEPPTKSQVKSEQQAEHQVDGFASSSHTAAVHIKHDLQLPDSESAAASDHEPEQNGKGRKRQRRGKERKPPVRSYPTRERAKAEAEVEAEAEALDAFSALAELADLAEANPEQSDQADEAPSSKRHKSSSSRAVSEAPSASSAQSTGKPNSTQHPAAHPAAPLSNSLSAQQKLQQQSQQWMQQLKQQRVSWSQRCDHLLQHGRVKVSELDSAAAQAEQYLWGDEETESVQAVAEQLQDAKRWVSAVQAAARNKPTREVAKPLIERDPPPCTMPAFTKLQDAYHQTEAWLICAADPISGKVTELKTLEALCSEASRIPLNIPESKELRQNVSEARKLAEQLRNLLPTNREAGRVRRKGEEPVELEALRAIKAQVLALHVTMPELTHLLAALERLDDYQQRAKECLRTRPELATLDAMAEEAGSLPAAVPETEGLTALIQKAAEWKARAAALAAQKAPLKKMREVLHLGLRMPVEVPQVESLRIEIRRREWEETAKKAVTSRTTLAALVEMLADAATMGFGQSDLMDKLQSRADAAEAFEAKAAPCLAFMQAAAVSTTSVDTDTAAASSTAPEEPHAAEGAAAPDSKATDGADAVGAATSSAAATVDTEMAEPTAAVDTTTAEFTAAADTEMAESTAAVDKAPVSQPKMSLAELEDLVQEGQAIGIKLDSLTDLARLLSTAKAWSQQAEFCLTGKDPQPTRGKKHQPPPSLGQVNSLKEQLQGLSVELPQAEALCQRQQQAVQWVDEARHILQQGDLRPRLPDVQAVVERGAALGLEMPELTELDALVRSIQWNSKVSIALGLPLQEAAEPSQAAEHGSQAADVVQQPAASVTETQGPHQAAASANGITPADPSGTTPSNNGLNPTSNSGQAVPDAGTSKAEAQASMTQAVASKSETGNPRERLTLAEAEGLLEEGQELTVEEGLMQQLQGLVETGQQWEAQVAHLLPDGSEENASSGSTGSAGVIELQQLLHKGEGIELQLESVQRLQALLQEHYAWELRLKQVMQGGGKPSYSALLELETQGQASPIASPLLHQLSSVLAVAQHWLQRCTSFMARRPSQNLVSCLEAMASSVQRAQEQMEAQLRKLQEERSGVQKQPQADSNSASASGRGAEYEENEQELLCVCQQPYNVDTAMISCDVCEDWYHLRCVGVTQTAAKSMKKYTCPVCLALKGNAEPLEAALAKNWKTLRPARNVVAQLLLEASALPCVTEEQHQMVRLLAAYDRWLGSVETIARGHEASVRIAMQGHHAAAAAARLPVTTLSHMLKSCLSVELDTRQVSQRLMRLIKADRWHMKAEHILRSHAKPTVETLVKVLKEAEAAELVVEQDPIGAILQQRATAGKRWQDQARTLMANLKEHAERPDLVQSLVRDAQVLVQQAPQLEVRLDKDVAKLQESSKIYCLCRQPYDELRPMLSCDHCNDWFHYDCIGLQPPKDNEDDDEVAPAEYRCPKCCLQAGMQYPLMHKLPARSLQHLHQVIAPLSLQHHAAYLHLQQHQHQPAAHASHAQSHQYPAQAQTQDNAAAAPSNPAGLAAQHSGLVHQFQNGQYQPAMQQHASEHLQGQPEQQQDEAQHQAAPEGSIEPGDDWIEQAFADSSHQTSPAATTANDQEAASRPFADTAQQASAPLLPAEAQQHPEHPAGDSNAQHMGDSADQAGTHAQQNKARTTATEQGVVTEPNTAADHFDLTSHHNFGDDDPANPDGKLMSLLMG